MNMEPELTESYAYGIVTPSKPPIPLPLQLPPPSRIYYPAGEQIDSQNSVTFLGLAQPPQGGGGSTYNRRARAKSGLAGLFVCVDVVCRCMYNGYNQILILVLHELASNLFPINFLYIDIPHSHLDCSNSSDVVLFIRCESQRTG
ncbi:unnamed protein product [Orchesella dallaii]|uniref:Uncharacterized protein n=1 Tax=Orchesella dallaii TaxID=48710 RepID=A0ABP1Q4N6_9HEXA